VAAQRDDYLLRLLAQLRELLARLVRLRLAGGYDEALQLLMEAQERLFGRPVAEVAARPLEDQIAVLAKDVPAAVAAEKCALYADLLREASAIFRARGAVDLAPAALTLAAQVVLTAVGRREGATPAPLAAAARELLQAGEVTPLPDGVSEGLRRLVAGAAPGAAGAGVTAP